MCREDKTHTSVCFRMKCWFCPQLIDSNQPHHVSFLARTHWGLIRWVTDKTIYKYLTFFFFFIVHNMGLPGHHWNSLHSRTKAKILLPASVAAWCQNVSCQRELQPNTCISLCFSVRNRSDKTSLTPSSCCAVWVHNRLKHHSASASGCSQAICARSGPQPAMLSV